jgi:hypothetical protein
MGYKKLIDLPEVETASENDVLLIATATSPGSKITFNNVIRSISGLLSYVKHFVTADFTDNFIFISGADMPFNGNPYLDVQVFDSVGDMVYAEISINVGTGDVIMKSPPFVGHLIVTGSNR